MTQVVVMSPTHLVLLELLLDCGERQFLVHGQN